VIDKRSNLVRLLRVLCGRVLNWGERLVYRGTRDESLPPQVLRALDAYLAESDSKLLVVLPVSDERELEQNRRPRSTLVLESFEPDAGAGKLVDRLEVIGRHAASALYNAAEHGGIPLRWVWRPLALVQQGLGGRARALALAIAAVLLAVVAALAVPPQLLSLPGQLLKMDARGQLLPKERRWLFSPVDAEVVRLDVPEDRVVRADQALMLLYFDAPLQQKLVQLQAEIEGIDKTITALDAEFAVAASPGERLKISTDKTREVANRQLKGLELLTLRRQTQAQWLPQEARPGWYFWLRSPLNGTVLTSDYQENLTNRYVKPAEPLLRVGNTAGPWEVELRIPQSHIGQVLKAMHAEEEHARAEGRPARPLDVDLMLMSAPTRCFRGKLPRDRIAPQASSNRDDNHETEPVVLTWVRLDGDDIPVEERVPRDLFLSGTEVHARIRCGEHPLGYTLFYGLWEFVYEKVVFLF
jgi:hypothetical protein